MKDKIQKLADLNKEVVELLKEAKTDEVISKMEEIAKVTEEMTAEVEQTEAKADEINKTVEEVKKYASLNISADTMKAMLDQFEELKGTINWQSETITKLNERLEIVEKTKQESKQGKEPVSKKEDSVWSDMWS